MHEELSGMGQSATNPAEMGTGGAGTEQSNPSSSVETTEGRGSTSPTGIFDTGANPSGNYNSASIRSPGSIAGPEDKDPAAAGKKKGGKGNRADAGTGGSGYDDTSGTTSGPPPRTP